MLLGIFLAVWMTRFGGKIGYGMIYLALRFIFYIIFNYYHCKYMVPVKLESYKTRINAVYAMITIAIESILSIGLLVLIYYGIEKFNQTYFIFLSVYHACILIFYLHFARVSRGYANRIKYEEETRRSSSHIPTAESYSSL